MLIKKIPTIYSKKEACQSFKLIRLFNEEKKSEEKKESEQGEIEQKPSNKVKVKLTKEELQSFRTSKLDRQFIELFTKKLEIKDHPFSEAVYQKLMNEFNSFFAAEETLNSKKEKMKEEEKTNQAFREELTKMRLKIESTANKMKQMNADTNNQIAKVKDEGELIIADILLDSFDQLARVRIDSDSIKSKSNEDMIEDSKEGIKLIEGSILTVLRRFEFERPKITPSTIFSENLFTKTKTSGNSQKIKTVLKWPIEKKGKIVKKGIVETE